MSDTTHTTRMQGAKHTGDAAADDATVAARQREVERNREQLAQTVDALQHKLDVKSKAQARLREAKERATTDDGRPRPVVLAGAAAVVTGVVGLVWLRRR